jgi:hypothetical protein
MPRSEHPPYGFTCPYTHHCPHLDGLSTTWVFGEYRRADEVYHEHLQIIDTIRSRLDAALKEIQALEKENAELKAKNVALHLRQFKTNRKMVPENPQGRSSADAGKKRGAPVGHPGWHRNRPAVNRTVHVPAPTLCPHCGSDKLTPTKIISEHVQEDIVIQPKHRRYPICTRRGILRLMQTDRCPSGRG